MKPDCYQCRFRGDLPGDTHSCCRYPSNETGLFDLFKPANLANIATLKIEGHPHGIAKGWFLWPVNYDPVWLLHCDGFETLPQEAT